MNLAAKEARGETNLFVFPPQQFSHFGNLDRKKNTHKKKNKPRVDRDHCVSDCFLGAVVTGFNHLSEKSVAASAWINTVDVILE